MTVIAAELLAAAPRAQPHIVAAIADQWDAVSAKYGLTNRNRAIGFLSTAYEESGGFTVLSENLNYSAARAAQVFPGYFPSVAAAQPCAFTMTGNGTQSIFYDRGDVFFASLHGDPQQEYPFFLGHADERGAGEMADLGCIGVVKPIVKTQ